MSAKHTPGPWAVGFQGDFGALIEVADGSPLAEVFGVDDDPTHWPVTANARLIAAAPDMFDALSEFVGPECPGHVFDPSCRYCAGRAALAKARGGP